MASFVPSDLDLHNLQTIPYISINQYPVNKELNERYINLIILHLFSIFDLNFNVRVMTTEV